MKPVQFLALLLACGCAEAPAQDNQAAPQPPAPAAPAAGSEAEQQAIMARIERDVRLPEGAGPLASYGRYYAWQDREDGVRKVLAIYVRGQEPGRHWVTETQLPLIMDGGCSIVELTWNVAEARIETIGCNGEA
jgi:hypothetical protein